MENISYHGRDQLMLFSSAQSQGNHRRYIDRVTYNVDGVFRT